MGDLIKLLDRIAQLPQGGPSAALATVVAATGSTYRRPGARMLIADDRSAGAVSAGCLEAEVISVAGRVCRRGSPELLRFDTTEEMDALVGTGLGCRGTIEVLIEPLAADGVRFYRGVGEALLSGREGVLALILKGDSPGVEVGKRLLFTSDGVQGGEVSPELHARLQGGFAEVARARFPLTRSYDLSEGVVRIYLERLTPPDRAIIFGAGFDALPVVQLGGELGFSVTVVDPRPDYLTPERFPGADRLVLAHPREVSQRIPLDHRTYVVILTHDYHSDLEILEHALMSEVPYVGQMGPRSRTEELLCELEEELGPLPPERLARLHAPVGLDLGAETPEEIALSVWSEVLAVRRARDGGFLRDRPGPIHERGN